VALGSWLLVLVALNVVLGSWLLALGSCVALYLFYYCILKKLLFNKNKVLKM